MPNVHEFPATRIRLCRHDQVHWLNYCCLSAETCIWKTWQQPSSLPVVLACVIYCGSIAARWGKYLRLECRKHLDRTIKVQKKKIQVKTPGSELSLPLWICTCNLSSHFLLVVEACLPSRTGSCEPASMRHELLRASIHHLPPLWFQLQKDLSEVLWLRLQTLYSSCLI